MKITIKDYPCTFSFEIDRGLPKFKLDQDECLRTEIVREEMRKQKIDSPCHSYDDYIVEMVKETKDGEIWYLGS